MTKQERARPLVRIYDWMLRRRLLREPQWGQPSFAQRLLRMRPLSAFVLALPAIVLCAWYSWLALLAHLGHEAELKLREPLTVGLFQLHVHDLLMRDWQRLIMPEPQRNSTLPTLGLALDSAKLDELDKRLPPDDGPSYYVDGFLIRNNRAHEVQVRYRGGKYWHHGRPQKSWKVRVKDGKSIGGFETFSLLNTPEVVPFEEDIILDIAREHGLLAPEYFPIRLLLNKNYMGVYFFEGQPDAGLLRRAGRAPGSVYSGSDAPIDEESGVSTLFRSADHFTKVAQGIHQQLGERDDLNALVRAINTSTPSEFVQYVKRHLDFDKFATLDALDVVFGCNQHDFGDNHKFYFDPYRDRFEPIAWNFRGCRHEPELNRTENPLLLRMKQVPGYLARRNQIVYQLLHGAGAPQSLRERTRAFLDALQPDQARSRYWDANQLLPTLSPYYSQLMRPVNRGLQDMAIETRLHDLSKRTGFLTRSLERYEFKASVSLYSESQQNKPVADVTRTFALDMTVGGESGYRLLQIEPTWPTGCNPTFWQLFADTDLDGQLTRERDEPLGSGTRTSGAAELVMDLYPGLRFEARRAHPTRGRIRALIEPRHYRVFLQVDTCELTGVTLRVQNLATGSAVAVSSEGESRLAPGTAAGSCHDTYREEVGYSTQHPWCLPRPRSEVIHLGPGLVNISQTRVFAENQSVLIAPGTTLRIARGASLVFYGRLDAHGNREHPVRLESTGQDWGGLAIQGPDAAGSRLSYVTFAEGTHPVASGALWPGVVNIQDTRDVTVDHCSVLAPRSEVGFHIAGVRDLVWSESHISNAAGNAVELKYSSATLNHLIITNAGRGAIVCAGSQVVVKDSRIVGSGSCAISAGQVTTLAVQDTLIANAECGLSVQEASMLDQQGVLLYRNGLGARLKPNDDRFAGKARLRGGPLYAVACNIPYSDESKRRNAEQQVVTHLDDTKLEPLRTRVLQIDGWGALDNSIARLMAEAIR